MKSNVKKIMEEKGVTVRDLMAEIDRLFPRVHEEGKKKGQPLFTSSKTIMNARDDAKIETCTLLTLKMIARALGVRVCDLFEEQTENE
ncbi:MAG: XRE family transcriptional regulator [Verrucomicrobiae bacterium]|nr:XRE family transcriptional regulator [Verrucomicrobiae bacterium]